MAFGGLLGDHQRSGDRAIAVAARNQGDHITLARGKAIGIGEFAVHYHVDWTKGQIDLRTGWTEKDQAYWMVFGADQLIHQLTYLAIVAYLAGLL